MDYGNFSTTVGQEEEIKIKIKFPKFNIGDEKKLNKQQSIAQKEIFNGDGIVQEHAKLVYYKLGCEICTIFFPTY